MVIGVLCDFEMNTWTNPTHKSNRDKKQTIFGRDALSSLCISNNRRHCFAHLLTCEVGICKRGNAPWPAHTHTQGANVCVYNNNSKQLRERL